ncbi:MAG TPA: DUF1624 domain-containing protein [Pararhizobium sp.]|nr:DUF1624 domain-containing protein [Pararhizobium sp.]
MDQENPVSVVGGLQTAAKARPRRRIVWIDSARGVAIVAMAVYHFAWDLQHFGYVTPPTIDVGGWKLFARTDASSFLFLVGVSLVLAHHPQIRWRGFWKRMAMIVAGAIAITVVTWFVTPGSFIFFGILHAIAAASLIGLLFLRLPPWLTIVIAVGVFIAPWYLASPIFDYPPLWFIGLSDRLRPSNDYVPLLPWLTPVLVGIAATKIAKANGVLEWLRDHAPSPRGIAAGLAFSGRHSLAIYLLHQPVLFGLVFLASQVAPAKVDPVANYLSGCQVHCAATNGAGFCRRFCGCTVDKLLDQKLFNPVITGKIDVRKNERVLGIAGQCTRDAASEAYGSK